jgi:hypothetical protein
MGLFTGIGDFFRGAFGEDDDEKRRRKEREAREAAARRAAQNQPRPQQNWNNQQNQNVQQFFGQQNKPDAPKLTNKEVRAPLQQQVRPVVQAPRVEVPAYQGGWRGVFERLGDQVEANSPQDIAKRKAKNKPKRYEDEVKDSFVKRNLLTSLTLLRILLL